MANNGRLFSKYIKKINDLKIFYAQIFLLCINVLFILILFYKSFVEWEIILRLRYFPAKCDEKVMKSTHTCHVPIIKTKYEKYFYMLDNYNLSNKNF